MIKSKILFFAVPFMALGTMFSLTACSKKYDLVIYNWEDYIFEGSKDADGTVKAFEKYYSEIAGKKPRIYTGRDNAYDKYTRGCQNSGHLNKFYRYLSC